MGEWAFELEICEPRTLAFNYCAWGEGVAETERGRERLYIYFCLCILSMYMFACVCVCGCVSVYTFLCVYIWGKAESPEASSEGER